MKCSKCENELKVGAKYCSNCGQRRKNIIYFIKEHIVSFALSVIFIIILFVVLFINSKKVLVNNVISDSRSDIEKEDNINKTTNNSNSQYSVMTYGATFTEAKLTKAWNQNTNVTTPMVVFTIGICPRGHYLGNYIGYYGNTGNVSGVGIHTISYACSQCNNIYRCQIEITKNY